MPMNTRMPPPRRSKGAAPAEARAPAARRRSLTLALLTLAAAAGAFLYSSSVIIERTNPAAATALWPGNDGAWSKRAMLELATIEGLDRILLGGSDSKRATAPAKLRSFAQIALAHGALNSGALRVLAYAGLIEGYETRAQALAQAANATSRRDVATQILLARRALIDKDVARALTHFDQALRVNSAIREQIFPMMAQALTYPDFQQSFAPYVRHDNAWIAEFLRFSIEKGLNPRAIGEVIVTAKDLPLVLGSDIRELAPVHLVSKGEIGLARAIALQLPPDRRPARDGIISEQNFQDTGVVEPFGWTYTPASQVVVTLPVVDGDALSISSSAAYSGELARQLLTLPAGRYRLRTAGRLGNNAHWSLTCTPGGQSLHQKAGTADFAFEVPRTGCAGQWLTLEARAIGPIDINLQRVETIRLAS